MSNMMRGGAGAQNTFPAPGLPSTAQNPNAGANASATPGAPGAVPPFPPFFNPFFPPPPAPAAGATASSTTAPGTTPAPAAGATPTGGAAPPAAAALPPLFNPFNPAAMQQMMGMYGNDPFGRFGGAGAAPSAPADSRPPEERFQVQLQVRHVVYYVSGANGVLISWVDDGAAIARYGVHECAAERPRAARDGREGRFRD